MLLNMKLLIVILVFQIITFTNSELRCNGENEALRCPTLLCPCPCACPPDVICNSIINKTTCQCINNTFRDAITKKCVKGPINCPLIPYCAIKNEAPVYPTPDCPATCQNRGDFRCATVTNGTTCQCVNNTIRDTFSGNCVKPDDCPPKCNKTNEAPVSATPLCPPTCQNRGQPLCDSIINEPSCQCVNDTIRDTISGNCVTPHDCPPQCNHTNEAPVFPTPGCPPTCQNGGHGLCLVIEDITTCQCVNNTIRDAYTGKCVCPDDCPDLTCNADTEVPKYPTPVCPATCQNRRDFRCATQSNTTTCQCADGYIRDTISGNCVTPDNCPE